MKREEEKLATDLLILRCEETLRYNTPEIHREPFYELFKRIRKLEREKQSLINPLPPLMAGN